MDAIDHISAKRNSLDCIKVLHSRLSGQNGLQRFDYRGFCGMSRTDFLFIMNCMVDKRNQQPRRTRDNMYTPTDEDVKVLLQQLKVDPEHAGAKNAADRLALLQKALQKTQGLSRVLRKASESSSSSSGTSVGSSTSAKLGPSTLESISSRGKLVLSQFDGEHMYSVQEKLAIEMGAPESNTAWFEARRTLWKLVDEHVERGVTRLHLLDSEPPHKMGGVIDIMGARKTPGGQVPLLETRHRFCYTTQVNEANAKVEGSTNPPGMYGSIIMEVEQEEIKLLAVLLDANASRLAPSYVSACQSSWGTGTHLTPSFLLPIEPLTQEVNLPKLCNVCGAEGARDCSGCRQVAYCGRECQNKDWKQHKPACKAVQAERASSSTSVVVDLTAGVPGAPFVTSLPTNASVKQMGKSLKGGPSRSSPGAAAGVAADPTKRFVVKVQAPLSSGMAQEMPLYLYDEKRKVVAYISSQQQAFAPLLRVIRQHGMMGAKLYCWAALDTLEQLRVFTEPLPSQTHSW